MFILTNQQADLIMLRSTEVIYKGTLISQKTNNVYQPNMEEKHKYFKRLVYYTNIRGNAILTQSQI